MTTLQDLIGAKDKASVFYVKLDNPANAEAVVQEVKRQPGMEKYVVRVDRGISQHDDAQQSAGLPAIHRRGDRRQLVIGFLVIFQSMYTAVMERTREIGILKSMGASKFYIINVILRETVVLALGGHCTRRRRKPGGARWHPAALAAGSH